MSTAMETAAMRGRLLVLSIASALLIAGCGGGSGDNANASPTPMTEAQRETNALPLAAAAPIPKDLKCKSEIVWVNMHTHVYHEKADPYYGKTKDGKYMCMAAANAEGYHIAGGSHSRP
jgi:hypothetical protein